MGEGGGESRHRGDLPRGPGWLRWNVRGKWEREGAAVAGEEAEAGPGRLAYYAGKLGFIWKIFKLRSERVQF